MDYDAKKKFAEKIGKIIRNARENKGMTQEELAYRCGIDRTYIGYIENGKYSPSAYLIWLISKKLKISTEKLFP